MKICYIYGLVDPITNDVKYIGKANNTRKRLHTHLTKNNLVKCTYKNNWINGLLNKKLKPELIIIDEVLQSEWEFWEKYWISQFKTWGFKLTNLTDGGGGVYNNVKLGSENSNYRDDVKDDKILMLISEGLSQKEIALRLNTNVALINKRMVKFNINFYELRGKRITNGDTHNYRSDITTDSVMKLINEGLSVNKISKILKTDRSTIKKRIKQI